MADDPAAALFSTRPGEFVAARDAMAAELRRQGRKEEAAAIKALPKPSPSVWALNQLAAREPEAIERLITASRALERTQGGADGEEGRRAYREALATQRTALDHLVDGARRALEEAGLAASRTVLDRIGSDLRSAVLDREAEEQLRQGRLLRDLGQTDFAALLDRIPAVSVDRPAPGGRPQSPRSGHTHAPPADDRAAHRKRLAEVEARLKEAEEHLHQAQTDARKANRDRLRAEERLATLKRQLAEADEEARQAIRSDEEASKTLTRATAARDRLAAERDAVK
jgi:exonuclease VII large subunit